MQTTMDISTPDELAALLEGKTDAEVEALIAGRGAAAVLDQVFGSMVERFLPERARGVRAVVQWHVESVDGPRAYHLRVEEGTCALEQGAAPSSRVALTARVPTFLRVVAGRLNGLQAFSQGDLRVVGDEVLALQQQRWFDVDLSHARLDISTPSELARLLEGREDAMIEAGTAVTGVDRALVQVFEGMVDHFRPHRGPRKRSVVEFSIRSSEGDRTYQFVADRGGASFHAGAREKSNVRLSVTLPNFLRLVSGSLDAIRALAQGKIRLRGNILLARGIQGWFDLSRK